MQGGPGTASSDGLLQLLWDLLSQVGLWEQEEQQVLAALGHSGCSVIGVGEVREGDIPRCC